MFVLTISSPSLNMGYVGLKTRSPGQILGNSCLHSRGHICNLIFIKLCQNVCFDNFQVRFEFWSCWVKNQVTRLNLRKCLFTLQRQHLRPILLKLCQNVCFDNIQARFEYVGLKTRSPGQILGNFCLHSSGYICNPILMKLCQIVCFDNIQAKFEYRSCRVINQVARSNHWKFLLTLQRLHFRPDFDESYSECLF